MEEFRIVVQHGSGKPFSFWTFTSYWECYVKLLEFIQDKSKQVKPEYYVLNDFYENKYPASLSHMTKYKIESREVTDWVLYSKEKEEEKENSKIIFFDNYKKTLTK